MLRLKSGHQGNVKRLEIDARRSWSPVLFKHNTRLASRPSLMHPVTWRHRGPSSTTTDRPASNHHQPCRHLNELQFLYVSVLLLWIVSGVDGCKYFDSIQRPKHYQLLASRYIDGLSIHALCLHALTASPVPPWHYPQRLGLRCRSIYVICMSCWVVTSLFDGMHGEGKLWCLVNSTPLSLCLPCTVCSTWQHHECFCIAYTRRSVVAEKPLDIPYYLEMSLRMKGHKIFQIVTSCIFPFIHFLLHSVFCILTMNDFKQTFKVTDCT